MVQDVAVIEIGSSKITAVIARRGVNNTFDIRGKCAIVYDGFCNGQWVRQESVGPVIREVLEQVKNMAKTNVKTVYVGVPGEFSSVITKDCSISFTSRRRVNKNDIARLNSSYYTYMPESEYKCIGCTPVYYMLDDNKMTLAPEGKYSSRLNGKLSYIFAKREFTKFIASVLRDMDVSLISSVWAEGMYLFEPEIRDRTVFYCDVGYLTTSVALMQGDGLLYMKSFSLGGGIITADLASCLHQKFEVAEILKQLIELSVDVGDKEKYEIITEKGVVEISAYVAHNIVKDRIEYITDHILKCMRDAPEGCAWNVPMFITGGGISYMRGAREVISRYMGMSVEIAGTGMPYYNKPDDASLYGILDLALDKEEKKRSLLDRLLGK